MKRNTVDIISLGCSKNLVDSEKLMRQLKNYGYRVTHDSDNPQGEIAVINTCGFIGDAKEESVNMILEFCQAKEEGRLKKLYVMGCLSERYFEELKQEIYIILFSLSDIHSDREIFLSCNLFNLSWMLLV